MGGALRFYGPLSAIEPGLVWHRSAAGGAGAAVAYCGARQVALAQSNPPDLDALCGECEAVAREMERLSVGPALRVKGISRSKEG